MPDPKKEKREFRGKTESDIEVQFTKWQKEMVGLVRGIQRHPIERLPLKMKSAKFIHDKHEFSDTFSMLVEYETLVPSRGHRPKSGQ